MVESGVECRRHPPGAVLPPHVADDERAVPVDSTHRRGHPYPLNDQSEIIGCVYDPVLDLVLVDLVVRQRAQPLAPSQYRDGGPDQHEREVVVEDPAGGLDIAFLDRALPLLGARHDLLGVGHDPHFTPEASGVKGRRNCSSNHPNGRRQTAPSGARRFTTPGR